jgi:DNA-binding XRE family transcriptional regulator
MLLAWTRAFGLPSRPRGSGWACSSRILAEAIGVSRQTLSLIEAGETVPSTQIALALARELRCRVEDLFSLRSDGQVIEAELVGEPSLAPKTQRKKTSIAGVGRRSLGRPSALETDEALALGTPADGIATLSTGKGRNTAKVRPLRDLESLQRNLSVAGCDPALGVLGRHLEERFPRTSPALDRKGQPARAGRAGAKARAHRRDASSRRRRRTTPRLFGKGSARSPWCWSRSLPGNRGS